MATEDYQAPTDASFVDSEQGSPSLKHPDPYEANPRDKPPGQSPVNDAANSSHVGTGDAPESRTDLESDGWLLQRAREIFTNSTAYMETNVTNKWEINLAHFRNEHATGTPYNNEKWRRSKVFRPKTRAITKSQEAALAAAAFSTQDLVDIEPENTTDQKQIISAQINKNILQYRLDRRMPWFLTVQGAYQDTKVHGICISHNYWDYQRVTKWTPAFDEAFGVEITDPQTGEPLGHSEEEVRIDRLWCDDIAPENFRFDPMSDWRDPVGSSPYLVYMMPMFAGDVLDRMEHTNPAGETIWRKHPLSAITATHREDNNRIRQAREGDDRLDPISDGARSGEYAAVWVHMNIIRVKGEDYVYWTLGTELLLTKARPLREVYPHLSAGERPFTMGFSTIEAHRNYPAGDVEQSAGVQQEINTVANQRLDNVKLVLNKRYYIRRGAQVDLDALVRNVPGGGVMMNDPTKDVHTVETRDVTSSSYQEQHMLGTEMDELVGNFSQGDGQTRKNPGETAMGIAEISGSANSIQDYGIRIFMETWMEPTLRQFVKLIQWYETDTTILSLAGQQSEAWQQFEQDEITDEILRQDLTVRINLGIGNTDPVRRVERLVFAVSRTAEVPGMAERMKGPEIGDEIFGTLGYKNASRFFMDEQEFQKYSQENEQGPPPEVQLKLQELEIRKADNEARNQREQTKLQIEREIKMLELALKEDLTRAEMYAKLGIEEMKDTTLRDATALREMNKGAEMELKRATGSGI